jgi:hypothetical protein
MYRSIVFIGPTDIWLLRQPDGTRVRVGRDICVSLKTMYRQCYKGHNPTGWPYTAIKRTYGLGCSQYNV